MFNLIKQYFAKFFHSKKIDDKSKINQNTYRGGVQFLLNSSNEIEVICALPDFSIEESDGLITKSESYANFLMHITNGYTAEHIISYLKKMSKNDSIDNKLFVDNVLFFWTALWNEHKKQYYKKSNKEPLIKPTEVFTIK